MAEVGRGGRPKWNWEEVGRKSVSTAPAATAWAAKAVHASAAAPSARGRVRPTDTSTAPPPAALRLRAVKERPSAVVGEYAKKATPPTVVEDTVVSRNTAGYAGREEGEGRMVVAPDAVRVSEKSQALAGVSLSPMPRAVMA